ncbi:MAG: isochorismatase family protein [bacterium]
MLSVLITQCLQRDFIDPVEAHVPLPNKLHVGREEALRLMGHDPHVGPVARILGWARRQPEEALEILHIRDWHDEEDTRQRDHLAMFGSHCVAGTRGAALVLGLDQEIEERANERVVNSTALNDFEGTSLPEELARIRAKAGDQPIRVAVIGVWTEAKVSFLLYDLKTRGGFDELATCSALTASASRAQHFNALDQLRKILGVQTFDSVGDLGEWLVPESTETPEPIRYDGFQPEFVLKGLGGLDETDSVVLSFLYRESQKVTLNALTGGYSGALVFRAQGQDSLGQKHAPSVAKVGPRALIGTERAAFERVESVLGNRAPSIKGFIDFGDRAGIKYSFASMGSGAIHTFQELYMSGLSAERTEAILREVFQDILEPFYSAALYERLPLLEYYTFTPSYADRVAEKVSQVHGPGGDAPMLTLADGSEVPNVAEFYRDYVPKNLGRIGEYHYVSYVHGDLNGANILIDGRENVWLIDFFHTERGHVLKDLIKLENDLLYIFTPLENEAALAEATRISRALVEINDLASPLPEELPGVKLEPLLRAWSTLRILREIGATYIESDRNPDQVLLSLIRYAIHTLSFWESDDLQKRWALSTACLAAERLSRRTVDNRELRIGWLDSGSLGGTGRVGLTLCPGRRDQGRNLADDLDVIQAGSIVHIWGLLTEDELDWAGVADIASEAQRRGIQYHHHPILDQSVPTLEEAQEVSRQLLAAVDAGENVLVHCVGGLGRTGALAACAAIDRGLSAEDAIALVRKARGPRAVESGSQVAFLYRYARRSDTQT